MSDDVSAWLGGAQERNNAAWVEIFGLCDGSRRWTMRVPVDSARDSDEVIAAALRDGEKAVAVVRAVLELVDDLDSYVAARGRPATGTYDDGLNRAQAAVAADLRRVLADADAEVRP